MQHKIALLLLSICSLAISLDAHGQQISIAKYSTDNFGRPLITIPSDSDHYYTLYARNANDTSFHAVSMAIGTNDSLTLSESLVALPQNNYRVQSTLLSNPGDIDNDGIDDVTELRGFPDSSPINPAPPVPSISGDILLESSVAFSRLARAGITGDSTNTDELYAVSKIYLTNNASDSIKGFFVNTNQHEFHVDFARAVGIPTQPNGVSFVDDMRGTIIFHPEVISKNGVRGVYSFHFGFWNAYSFEIIQRAHDLLAANMPFLRGNLAYRPRFEIALDIYEANRDLYDASRIQVVTEDELFSGLNYLALNEEIGFGRLSILDAGESPSPFDIVISESVPDELPRVAGILTGSVQTPLAHVNLRAIQDGIPNAYIRDVFTNPAIEPLIGQFIKLTVSNDTFEVRLATQTEVDDHFESIRPDSIQVLGADLSQTEILPLDQIRFSDVVSVGAKASNIGQLTTLPFVPGTLPEGFAIPFYFYDRFMIHNGFYNHAAAFLEDDSFRQNLEFQEQVLRDFRRTIEFGIMPADLFDELTELQAQFPETEFIRCRSSSNNEDLPNFSGAGLYDSKTHRPDEGHLVNTVRQIFAGLWTYRAFVEREFYKIDHLSAKMGVLVHPSYKDELANGVGVSTDPLYGTENQFYLNSQFQEELVTNPDGSVSPEEILLTDAPAGSELDYEIVRQSSLISFGDQLLDSAQLVKTRDYLKLIHEEFKVLYEAENSLDFAMEIEYKIDKNNQFIIKQARPWVGFSRSANSASIPAEAILSSVYPNPATSFVNFPLNLDQDYGEVSIHIYDAKGSLVQTSQWSDLSPGEQLLRVDFPVQPVGIYFYEMQISNVSKFTGSIFIR